MREVLTLTVPFFGLVFLGFLVGRIAKRPATGLEWMNIFIVYLALPALFFQYLSQTPIQELSNVTFIGAAVGGTAIVVAAGFVVAMIRTRGDIGYSTILALVGGYANNGYLGPGLAITALGASATVPVALIFSLESTLFFVITPVMMAVAGSSKAGPLRTALLIVRRILTHPFILAVIAGIAAAAFQFEPPEVLDRLLDMLMGAAAPCALFAMGVTVALQPVPTARSAADISLFISFKLITHPLAVHVMLTLVNVDPLWHATAVLMAALPTATNVFVLATQYKVGRESASNAILVSTACAAVTVTAVLYAVRAGAL